MIDYLKDSKSNSTLILYFWETIFISINILSVKISQESETTQSNFELDINRVF